MAKTAQIIPNPTRKRGTGNKKPRLRVGLPKTVTTLRVAEFKLRRGCDFFEAEESTHHTPCDVALKTKGF